MKPFTVVYMNLDRSDAFVEHAFAEDARTAYEKCLRQLHDEGNPDPTTDPFDLKVAEDDRPLIAVFAGHITNLADQWTYAMKTFEVTYTRLIRQVHTVTVKAKSRRDVVNMIADGDFPTDPHADKKLLDENVDNIVEVVTANVISDA